MIEPKEVFGKRGGFFAIDRRTWGKTCSLGMNEAVAYLVLAQGTAGNNRSTSWSTTSLKSYAGISWERGKAAIERLMQAGIIRHGEKHSTQKPRYELLAWAEVALNEFDRQYAALSACDRMLIEEVCTKMDRRITKCRKVHLDRLCELGVLRPFGPFDYTVVERPSADADPDMIWLPNTIVTGTDRGEESPVRRLRSGGDIWTLQLLVDLYHSHNLRDDGGISPQIIRQNYERKLIGQQGIFNVWAFKQKAGILWWKGPFEIHSCRPKKEGNEAPVWGSIQQLQQQGLFAFIPHLLENDSEQAEVLHPYGIEGIGGEPPEIEIAQSAHQAGLAMALDYRYEAAVNEGYCYLAPLKNTLPGVQMVGVGRLTYRPHTSRTGHWYRDLTEAAPRWIRSYRELQHRARQSQQRTA